MDFLHDAGEEELEEEGEEEEEEEQDVDAAVEPAPPAPHPAAGAHTGLTDEELAGLDATSVELLPDAERKAALAAAAGSSKALLRAGSCSGGTVRSAEHCWLRPGHGRDTSSGTLRALQAVGDYLTRSCFSGLRGRNRNPPPQRP